MNLWMMVCAVCATFLSASGVSGSAGDDLADIRLAIERFAQPESSTEDWARDVDRGMGLFVKSIRRIWNEIESESPPADYRNAIYEGILDILDDYPFLKYQAFYESRDGRFGGSGRSADVRNSLYVQFMARWLPLTLLNLRTREELVRDQARWEKSVFPDTPNGRMAARFFAENQILLLGVGFDDVRNVTFLFQDSQIDELIKLFCVFPRQLIAGPAEKRRLKSITIHDMGYIRGMKDFAEEFYPDDARWMGYKNGISLNVFGGPEGSPNTDVGYTALRFDGDPESPLRVLKSNHFLIVFAHELTHIVHSTVVARREDYRTRLTQLLDFGVSSKANIRHIDYPPSDNFVGTGKPVYQWFRDVSQESVATMANVLFVDSETVLSWAVAIAGQEEAKIQPLNHILWLIDALSFDENYREMLSSFLFTMQPTGSHITKVPLSLRRDGQGRIISVQWADGRLEVEYNSVGWAVPKAFDSALNMGKCSILIDQYHGGNPPTVAYFRAWPNMDIQAAGQTITPRVLSGVDLLYIGAYNGEAFSEGEMNAIWNFVREGGNLFIQTLGWSLEAYKGLAPKDNPLNVLCKPFGIWFNSDHASGESVVKDIPVGWDGWKYTRASMPSPELLPNVRWIVTWGVPSSIEVEPPAFPLIAFQSGGVLVAAAKYGKGKVVAMQPSGFYDGSLWLDSRTEGPDNAQLIDDILRWFMGLTAKAE